jgi:NADH-quinone oxidoreductase subunit J
MSAVPALAELAAGVAAQAQPAVQSSVGEVVTFWVVGPVAVLSALGLVLARKAVHGALLLALTMICLAIMYIAQSAPFLGIVQVVVYTGAIMMLFLFVLMLVGVDASDSLVETLKGQRWLAVLLCGGIGLLLVAGIGRVSFGTPAGLASVTPDGNVPAVAEMIFTRYVWAFEVTSALLITAALGAMVLAHKERMEHRPSQRELSERRFHRPDGDLSSASTLPSSGVYARHNAVDTPALLPDGSVSELSISRVLAARGTVRPVGRLGDEVAREERHEQELEAGPHVQRDTPPATGRPDGEGPA